MNISGSSEIMTVTTTTPVPNPRIYLRTSVEENKWLYLSITVGGFALEWFRKNFCREMTADEFYGPYMTEATATMEHGTVKFLPHLSGDRHSLVKKRGSFSGLTADTTREDMLRALLEGTFDPMEMSLSIISKSTKLNPEVFLSGGVVSDAYMSFKERYFKGYKFNNTANCSGRGMAKAAIRVLKEEAK
jgi:sugar (pentulose or hexulose) kinase